MGTERKSDKKYISEKVSLPCNKGLMSLQIANTSRICLTSCFKHPLNNVQILSVPILLWGQRDLLSEKVFL